MQQTVPYSAVLDELEAEAIHIYRESAAAFRNPVLLYSIGKDSSVLLHLAIKAFYPAPLPFPVMHIDTTWKFKEMIEFRDKRAKELGLDPRWHFLSSSMGGDVGLRVAANRPDLVRSMVITGSSARAEPADQLAARLCMRNSR